MHVLVLTTVISSSTGITTDARFQEITSRETCEAARDGIQSVVAGLKGTIGREVFAECFPK